MRCHLCGGTLDRAVIALPFRVSGGAIVIVKELPVVECTNCTEYSLEDKVMARVEKILDKVDDTAELEVVKYAA